MCYGLSLVVFAGYRGFFHHLQLQPKPPGYFGDISLTKAIFRFYQGITGPDDTFQDLQA